MHNNSTEIKHPIDKEQKGRNNACELQIQAKFTSAACHSNLNQQDLGRLIGDAANCKACSLQTKCSLASSNFP
ncbi:hypothetical protein Droror1_Dr00008767 [Drosera rotundifolia]